MRIGASLLLLNGTCFQSYGWNYMRPLGGLQNAVNFLEQYACDEIAIIRPVREIDKYFERDCHELKNLQTMTPISIGGGIREVSHLKELSSLPVERLIFSTAFLNHNMELIKTAQNIYGRQAVQCLLPFSRKNGEIQIYNSSSNNFSKLEEINTSFIDKYANEIILYDISNEGNMDKFDVEILDKISFDLSKLIISGGVGKKIISNPNARKCASLMIENRVLHKEYSIESYFRHV